MTAPQTSYDGDARVVWNDSGFDVTCCPGDSHAPTARIELWLSGEVETFYTTGDPERAFYPSVDEAIHALIGEPAVGR